MNVLPLVKRGYAVTGMDVSQEMLNQFSQKLHEIPQNLKLLHADASQHDSETAGRIIVRRLV